MKHIVRNLLVAVAAAMLAAIASAGVEGIAMDGADSFFHCPAATS